MLFWILQGLQCLVVVALGGLALKLRTPLLASIRIELLWLVPLGLTAILLFNVCGLWLPRLKAWPHHALGRTLRLLLVVLCAAGLAILLTNECRFWLAKRAVFTSDRSQLERLGQHFIVGYRRFEEIQTLVDQGGIGGIFITRRNLEEQTPEELQQAIADLQALRQRQNLPPLWIATDQEGGVVSRLSPPLTQLPPLATVVAESASQIEWHQRVRQYGATQGRELAALGVNLNFAPVVDLNKGIINPNDKYSQIYRRAISDDKTTVADVAQDYCVALEQQGVRCTLKHFPGLGRLESDTHLASAHLDTPIAKLAQDDWVPFRQVMGNTEALTMLGHPVLTAVDDQHPVSFSEAVVTGILRQQWQHNGLLITDDFSMGAVFNSRDGLKGAVVKALNAGVDLILISYDPDLYYPAIAALMRADSSDRLSPDRLAASSDRLQQHPPPGK